MVIADDPSPRPALSAIRLQKRLQASQAQQIRITPDAARRRQPFPLADMQHAYWMGRQATFSHAGAIQFYAQYHCRGLDLPLLERAWNALIARHDMLRATVGIDGLQRVAESVPYQFIGTRSLIDMSPEQRMQMLDEMQRGMQEECIPLEQWPQSRLHFDGFGDEGDGYLHIKLDLWSVDGRSLHILFDELAQLYQRPNLVLPELQMQFCDYIAALQEQEGSLRYQRALERWRGKLKNLPPAPMLPHRAEGGDQRFQRWFGKLEEEALMRLNANAQHRGLSLAVVILTVYASTLARWSSSAHFTLSVPRFNRPDWHPDIGNVIGEFASFSLLEVDLRERANFAVNATRLQTQLWDDLDFQEISGVQQLRELARLQSLGEAVAMPIVFTTTPDLRNGAALTPQEIGVVFGEPVCVVSRTPQVLLDCQYLVNSGTLLFNWDAMPSAFPDTMLDTMFDAFSRALARLAEDDDAWNAPLSFPLPPAQAAVRVGLWQEAVVEPVSPSRALQERVVVAPQLLALVSAQGVRLTYAEFLAQVTTLAQELAHAGVGKSDRVVLLMQRGWQQAVALQSCLWLGAVAVPLDRTHPEPRLRAIVAQVAPKAVMRNAPIGASIAPDVPCITIPDHPTEASLIELAPAPFDANAVCCVIFTSGSTGQPKGVEICQRAVANFLQYSIRSFDLQPSDRIISVTAQHHDLALFDQLATFCVGATLVVPNADRDIDPAHWLELLRTHRVSVWNSVPRFMEMVLSAAQAEWGGGLPTSMRQVILGGDWVAPALAARLLKHPGLKLRSSGGPTETTVWNITHEVSVVDTELPSIPYGRSIDNCRYYVLDELLQECPDHVPGEMYCAGLSLARGYLDDPAQTALRFLTHPMTGEHLYRTGDRGVFRPDGNLLILGRTDFQINAGGYRCDPMEIESALQLHPAVKHTVALEVPHQDGSSVVAACYLSGDQPCSEDELRALCAERLPVAAIPRVFLPVSEFPRTTNGKIDRRRLVEIATQHARPVKTGRPPRNTGETQLAAIWQDLLGKEITDVEAGFFPSGGDSLSATRLLLQIEKTFGVRPPLAMVFSHPTIEAMVEWLAKHRSTAEAVAPWPTCQTDHPPQSWAQQRLWFMSRIAPGNPFFNLCYCLELDGSLDAIAFENALRRLMERHEPLRSRFPAHAPVGTYVVDKAPSVMEHEDLRDLTVDAKQKKLMAWAEREKIHGFDLENGPLLRARLFRVDTNRHVLFYSIHHIAFDGWSAELFNREIFALYQEEVDGLPPSLPPVAKYADFAQSQHDLPVEQIATSLAFWRNRLAGIPPLQLPEDHRRPPVQSFRGAVSRYRLGKTLAQRVDAFSGSQGVTPFMTLLTAMQIALGRMAEQQRFVMGSVISGRDHPATETMLGFFINNLLLCGDLSGNLPFDQHLARVRNEFLDAQKHQHYPLQQLVQAMSAGADASRNPLHQVSFTYQPTGLAKGKFGRINVMGRTIVSDTTHMDLEIIAIPDGDELILIWLYARDIYSATSIDRWNQAFENVLSAALQDPPTKINDLPLAHSQACREWACVDGGPVLEGIDPWPIIQQHAIHHPQREVLRLDDGSGITWTQLLKRTERVASWVAEHALPEKPVAIRLHPGVDYVATILAALRLGQAWVPLDPRRPQQVIAQMLGQSEVGCLISNSALWSGVPVADLPVLLADRAVLAPPVTLPSYLPANDESLALIQHTSGSEGLPKGVRITYGNLRRRLAWGQTPVPLTPHDVGCLKTSPAFVDAVGELLDSLLADLALVIPSPDQARSPLELARLVRRHGISRLVMTPSLADAFFAMPEAQNLPLRIVVLGGENVRVELAHRCLAALHPDACLLNYYGATEITSDGAWHRITPENLDTGTSHVEIGLPLPGTRIWLLDSNDRLVAPGCAGEIHVSGQNLAAGYCGSQATAVRPLRLWTTPDGETVPLYATGDIAVRTPGGRLLCLGRRDHQFKLRGMRVEAGEIESQLRRHPSVRDALVAVDGEGSQQRLVAHVLLTSVEDGGARTLRNFLAESLPAGLIPSHWSLQREWPYTPTGKVDRRALCRDALVVAGAATSYVGAGTPLQQAIVDAWKGLLGVERVGIHDNFFEMGGNSLLLAQLHRHVCQIVRREFPLTLLFQHPNIHALSLCLEGNLSTNVRARKSSSQRAKARLAARERP
ncbi:amino acid adenylation domain-containing protein [Verminephrobacter aporrectodeae subsp. tuberculatae]|uniref:non-ribosomal peptide synthetase n=1 Tax=Verminephrobacter aporrectodeae TaxID=1110389 RepID=UPI002243A27A|nr:non-ribosomal peptide synthetase [Verminephrobacter aporrectodeae]MCW8205659.1 amino acid adenylation domain-containing protein [Verminephrobacter aporrectodeae subsp. tuberculatae]